ncbi:MAG: hypothetical protein ACRDQ5_19455 [Sciscionella sp.]
MRRGLWIPLALVIALLGAVFTGELAAALPAQPVAEPATMAVVSAAPDNLDSSDATGSTQPPGPNLDQKNKKADVHVARNKAIVGVIAALLLVIVFYGHRSKSKYRKKLKNLQNAKG